ncbi:MAG: hypothetical protein IRY94_16995, partial [Rhodospirillaceae bacterium]|nr:hypothetical protein [Rhodospirillaceae bacterium]
MPRISLLAGFAASAGVVLALLLAPASAEEGKPVHVRGTIERLDGTTLLVKSREGQDRAVRLADGFKVNAVATARIADIKQGDFVGAAALPDAGGKLHAQEVLIFPEALRGTGEGHYPWDLTPGSTMTNATVAEVAGTGTGGTLMLKYEGGEKALEVPADAPVVTLVPGDASLLTPGTAVFVPARQAADGSLSAGVVIAGKDGV